MASLVPWLKFAGARKSDGTAVASGTAYFYSVGSTSELLTLYSNANETATISNPVTLDAGGRASVYVKVAGQVIIKDFAGSTISQADSAVSPTADQVIVRNINYYGNDAGVPGYGKNKTLDSILTDLASSLGVDGEYTESPTATPRPIKDMLGDYVTPEDYGAVGNGTTDDTVALQAAITRAAVSHKPLKLGPKTYKTTTDLLLASAIDIIGAGMNSSIINCTGETNVLTIGIVTGSYSIRDCSLITTSTADGTCGVERDTYTNNGTFTNVKASGRWGFKMGTATGTRFINCVGMATDASGAEVGGIAFQMGGHATAIGCTATNTATGDLDDIGFSLGTGCVVIGCVSTASTGYSWNMVTNATAIGCEATSVNGFLLDVTIACGAIGCSSAASTANFTSTSGVNTVNIANSWTQNQALVTTVTTATGATASWTPDLSTGKYQVLKCTYAGEVSATVNAPTETLAEGEEFYLIIQASAASLVTITYNSAYKYLGGITGAFTTLARTLKFYKHGSNYVLLPPNNTASTDGAVYF